MSSPHERSRRPHADPVPPHPRELPGASPRPAHLHLRPVDPGRSRPQLHRRRAAPADPDLGNIIADGRNYIAEAPWITIWPGLAIMATVLGLNLMGDGLRDLLDPRLKQACGDGPSPSSRCGI